MHSLVQDLRYGLRSLVRTPGWTAVAVLSLALGIGANATVFSLVNAMLLRPLPVADPGSLYRLGLTRRGSDFGPLSYPELQDVRAASDVFAEVMGHQPNNVVLRVGNDPKEEMMEMVTGNYFSALAIPMALGRGFLPDEDRTPGTHAVTVISHQLWRARFASDPGVVGQTVHVNAHPFTVVGVAPPNFKGTFAGFEIALWVPVLMHASALPGEVSLTNRSRRFLMGMARLQPGVTPRSATARLAEVSRGLSAATGDSTARLGLDLQKASGVHPFLAGVVKVFLSLLMAIVGLVLVVACFNAANLLLARAATRRREIAVRLSMGATRARIVGQLLVECALLTAAASTIGLLIAFGASRFFTAFRPPVGVPIGLDVSVDSRVLIFTILIAAITAAAFGLAPALRASRADLVSDLKGAELPGRRRGSARRMLVIAQVAVSSVLLAGATLLGRSLANSRILDPGFDARNMLVVAAAPDRFGYDEVRGRELWNRLADRVRALPGVEDATLALMVPLGDRGDAVRAAREEEQLPGGFEDAPLLPYNYVSRGYFSAMRIPLVRGEDFAASAAATRDQAIVNEAFVRRHWPEGDPVGRRVRIWDREGNDRVVQVVGVARDSKFRSLGSAVDPFVYLPFESWYRADMRLHVRTRTDMESVIPLLVQEVHAIDPELPATVTTMADEMAFTLVPAKVAGGVLGTSGAIGLFLAAIGLFGVISWTVAQRTREIGVRIALGARSSHVRRLVVGGGIRLTLIGLAIGLPLAFAGAQLLRGLLYGVGPSDPVTFVTIAVSFVGVTLLVSYVPVRRATRVEPAVVLRGE